MRALALVALLLAACAKAPPPAAKGAYATALAMPPEEPKHVSSRSAQQVAEGVADLTVAIGMHPARVTSEADRLSETERARLYARWCDLLRDARALDESDFPDPDRYFTVNADLYRQGYELGVTGAAEESDRLVSECLSRDALSELCHRERVLLYLTLEPSSDRYMQVEASLETLRAILPAPDESVEAQFVALRLLSGDAPGALAAMDVYLEKFPQGSQAELFRKLQKDLDR